jgi:type IV pilus assembly protein PilA
MMWLRKDIKGRDEGFTLIELMVVVLIIAILIAIAIPTFLGARRRAQNRAAQSNLRNALTTEKTYFVDAQIYTSTPAVLQTIETALQWVDDSDTTNCPTSARQVCVQVFDPVTAGQFTEVDTGTLAASGNSYVLADSAVDNSGGGGRSAGTFYACVTGGAATLNGSANDPDQSTGWGACT